jgi:hypothetical protein
MSHISSRRFATLAVATLSAVASTAAPALAGGGAGCPAARISNPFSQWGDNADYQLAPGGSVEDGAAGWTLRAGASTQEGNETFMVSSPTDHRSLRLPAGSSATTDRMCIGVEHSSFRFFVKRGSGSSLSRLVAEVVVDDPWGRERSMPVRAVSGSGSWAPSDQLPTILNLLAPFSASSTLDVSFRFRPIGDATWSIDDVYVDPYRTY